MDISSIGAQYLNSAYVPLSTSAGASLPAAGYNTEQSSFAELLKKAQVTNKDSETPSSPVSKKLPIDKNDKLYELCVDLETFLIKNLIKSMRSTVQKSSLIESGFAGEMYEDMLYDEYAKDFTKNANFGFAEMAYRELTGNR